MARSMSVVSLLLVRLAPVALFAVPAHAAVAFDPLNDILPTFTGAASGDMDVITTEATVDNVLNTIRFHTQVNGAVGTTPGGFYVWGVDRGAGTARFVSGTPSIGAGVLFDMVVILRPDGTGAVTDLISTVSTPLAAGSAIINGNIIESIALPLSLFPTQGFAPTAYTINLWPRTGNGNALVTDFAPNASNVAVTVVPAPGAALAAMVFASSARGRRRASR